MPNCHKEMDVRALLFSTLIVTLLGSTSVFADGPSTLGYADNHNIEPVLVHVNAHGQVTDFTPAYPLTPELMRLLSANLNDMIHTSVTDKNGKPVPTQFVINVSLETTPRSSGGYDAQFAYVSASSVPVGRWYWSHDDIGRLGLASRDVAAAFEGINDGPLSTPNNEGFNPPSTSSGGGGHSGGGHH